MGALAWTWGIIAGLCTVMGIITLAEVIPVFGAFTGMVWFTLSVILFLACIAFAVGRGGYE